MKNKVKHLIKSIISSYLIFLNKRAYRKKYKSIYNNGSFRKVELTKSEKKLYLEKWAGICSIVDLETVTLCKSFSGVFDVNIVPDFVYSSIIEAKLNCRKEISFLEIKNVYNKWFDNYTFPKVYFHKVNNLYYDSNLKLIKDFEVFFSGLEIVFPIVCKPSIDTYGGEGVLFINSREELLEKLKSYKNLVIQEKLVQSPLINIINRESINSVRVCLYRSVSDNCLYFLNSALRMGVNGSLDNETDGGIVCSINREGRFNNYAINKFGMKYFSHPNSNFIFEGNYLPFYNEMITKSLEVGNQILLADILSLDMCLDGDNKWRCIEVNLFGQTIRFEQYAGSGFFDKFTDEVISLVRNVKE